MMIGLSAGFQVTSRPLFQGALKLDSIPALELYPYFLVLTVVLVGFIIFGIYYK
jgi:hypothetical protein